MTRKIKIFTVALIFLIVGFTWLLAFLYHINHIKFFEKQSEIQSTIVSQIDFFGKNRTSLSPNQLSTLSSQLKGFAKIDAWFLLGNDDQVLAQSEHSSLEQYIGKDYQSIYFKSANNQLIQLNLYFNSDFSVSNYFDVTSLVLALLLVLGVLLICYLLFGWVYRQETYAKYILESSHESNILSSDNFSSATSQALAQLILEKHQLLKDKTLLTEQIRRDSYVDESSRLGNQLFFKAEFEVRLHNKNEPESGLMMLLSFVQQDDREVNEVNFQSLAILLKSYILDYPNALVARLRNNDFGLLLPNLTRENVDVFCKKLINQLEKSFFDQNQVRENFIAIGISAYKQGFDYFKVLAEADMALRNAELQSGNTWFMYGEGLSKSKVRGHLKWRSFLQQILDRRTVQLHGQRIHYFHDSEKEHQEILARIKDGKDVFTADMFLPMALNCGLASQFDRQVIEGVINHCSANEVGIANQYVTINLFITSLLEKDFADWLIDKLSQFPSICQHLFFELKESDVARHLEQLHPIFNRVVELGAHWSIEKFGSPEEDMSYVGSLPIKQVKIDRRIVSNIHSSYSHQQLLKMLLINLQGKSIDVFAEGVENEVDAIYLREAGIIAAQGYYFSEPERLCQVESHLKQRE